MKQPAGIPSGININMPIDEWYQLNKNRINWYAPPAKKVVTAYEESYYGSQYYETSANGDSISYDTVNTML